MMDAEADHRGQAGLETLERNGEKDQGGYPKTWTTFGRKEGGAEVGVKLYRVSFLRPALLITKSR